jgi:hypothetical protein
MAEVRTDRFPFRFHGYRNRATVFLFAVGFPERFDS